MPVSKEQALTVDRFHYGECTCTVGPRGGKTTRVVEYRRNGATQTWKTRPADFRVPIKWGGCSYAQLTQGNAHLFHTEADCPLAR